MLSETRIVKPAGTLLIVTLLLATHMLAGRADAECIVPPAGLVTSWPGNGSTADTESGFDGTLVSGANFAPGFDAQAFHFDGVGGERDDRVDLPTRLSTVSKISPSTCG